MFGNRLLLCAHGARAAKAAKAAPAESHSAGLGGRPADCGDAAGTRQRLANGTAAGSRRALFLENRAPKMRHPACASFFEIARRDRLPLRFYFRFFRRTRFQACATHAPRAIMATEGYRALSVAFAGTDRKSTRLNS